MMISSLLKFWLFISLIKIIAIKYIKYSFESSIYERQKIIKETELKNNMHRNA